LIYVTVGTGIGAGIISKKQVSSMLRICPYLEIFPPYSIHGDIIRVFSLVDE